MDGVTGRRANAALFHPCVRSPLCVRACSVAGTLLATLLLSSLSIDAHAASWERAAQVVYLDDAAPVMQQDMSAALDYAIAAWSARLDVDLQRTDAAVVPGYNAGLITIRWLDSLEMVQGGSDIFSAGRTRRWLYSATGTIAGAEIFLSRDNVRLQDSACLTHVLVHELGHALGLTHLPSENAVMHASLDSCHHTLTADDIAAAPYPQHICHAELLPSRDLYIPVIRIGEKSWSVRLAWQQDHWALDDAQPLASQPDCDDTWLDGGTLVLDRIWTQDRVWQAELGQSGEEWHLKSAR